MIADEMRAALRQLDEVCPAAAGRARSTLPMVLAWVDCTARPEAASRFSRLTADGFPVELSFVTGQSGSVRYAAEVAGPEVAGVDRLGLAADLLTRLGHPWPGTIEATLRRMQWGQPLRWGAWIGVRHGLDGDSAKVYAEVPPAGAAFPDVPRPALPMRLQMASYEPSTGRLELYWRLARLDYPALSEILRLGRQEAALPRMAAVLRLLAGERADGPPRPLPAARFGCSVAVRDGDPRPEVALFASTIDLAGPDARARRHVDAALDHLGTTLPGYHRLAPGHHRGPPRHVMLGLAALRGHLALSVSVRPSAAAAALIASGKVERHG
jgi:hypothetical protein